MAAENRILNAQPITFCYKGQSQRRLGFSAEQLAEIDPLLVNLDREGRPDSISHPAMFAYIVAMLQNLDQRLRALEARDDVTG